MKKFGGFNTLVVLMLSTLLFAFACRNDSHDYAPKDRVPTRLASIEEPADWPGSLSLVTGLDNTKYMATGTGTTGYYYVEAKANPVEKTPVNVRSPLNISLVIDKSGSMAGGKLSYAKQAAKQAIDQLAPEDYVSIVIYGTDVSVIASSNKVGNKEVLKSRIDAIQTSGNTNLSGGMLEGYRQVKSTYKAGYVNRVLLLSDGRANIGTVSNSALEGIVRNKSLQEGITISCFGLGLDFNEDLMTGLADNGNGNYYFIENPETIGGIFQRELEGLLHVVAQNAELTIFLPPNVVLQHVFGNGYMQVGNRVVIELQDVMAGETKSVLLRFSTFGNPSTAAFHTGLTYVDALLPNRPVRQHIADDVLSPTASVEEMGSSFNPSVKSQVVLFESNDNLERALKAVDAGRFDEARKLVGLNDHYLNDNIGYVHQSAELQTQMSNNSGYQQQLGNVETLNAQDLQLLQKSNKAYNYDLRKKR
jgi:Ca-activated chloride channel homolog